MFLNLFVPNKGWRVWLGCMWVMGLAVMLVPSVLQASIDSQPSSMDYKALQRGCLLAYYPNSNQAHVSVDMRLAKVRLSRIVDWGKGVSDATVSIMPLGKQQVLATGQLPVRDGMSKPILLTLPDLQGQYIARFTLQTPEQTVEIDVPFIRERFTWENNQLGITDEVYPPFSPVQATSNGQVKIVDRLYQLNGLGLMNQVTALDRALLASPMSLQYELANGQVVTIEPGTLTLQKSADTHAVYTSSSHTAQMQIDAHITIEFDGMTKVQWIVTPGENDDIIKRMWLDIPIKSDHAKLMHNVTDTNRVHHIGSTPSGQGVVWTSNDARRQAAWVNSFNAYLWLGNETRGLAWFAENDKDWITEKAGSTKPIQQVVRDGQTTHLQVNFINTPAKLGRPRTFIFGLQVPPTKPRPEGWKSRDPMPPGMSGPVNAWGGIQCAAKSPYKDSWEVVDKINEGRQTGKVDKQWFKDWAAKNNPPLVHGRIDWVKRTTYLADREAKRGTSFPTLTYFEEMRASTIEKPWITFQDEWGVDTFTDRQWPDEAVMRRGFNASPYSLISFPQSYQDMCLFYANEWFKRGVGLYCDNTYPQACYDPLTSAAYVTEDGTVQPALSIWNQRAYQKRLWNLLQEHRKTSKVPLEWSIHMTTTLLLPLQTFATIQLDYEFNATQPAKPDYIRTTMLGSKCGNLPYALYHLAGRYNPLIKNLSKPHVQLIEWGMRRVHELAPAHDPGREYREMEDILHGFGYGKPGIPNYRYWDDQPVAQVEEDQVKWMLVHNPKTKQALILLASWNPKDTQATLRLLPDLTEGQSQSWHFIDARTGEPIDSIDSQATSITLPAPYGVRVLLAYQSQSKPQVNWTFRDAKSIAQQLMPQDKKESSQNEKQVTSVLPDGDPYRGVDEKRLLFKDDFESGVSSQWTIKQGLKAHTITLDNGKQKNVGRMSQSRARIFTPPIAGRSHDTQSIDQQLSQWKDYALRFRFRLGPIVSDQADASIVTSFFRVDWRNHRPTPDHPSEYKLAYIQAYRPKMSWRVDGPRVAWNGSQPFFDMKNMTVGTGLSNLGSRIDQHWHELEVRTVGDRSQVRLDGKVIIDAKDQRAPSGGIGISTLWNHRAQPTFMDIDDLVVWQIDTIDQPYDHQNKTAQFQPIYAQPANVPPTIDGKIDDVIWQRMQASGHTHTGPWYRYIHKSDKVELPVNPRQSWVSFDDRKLYIAMRATTSDIMALKPGPPGNPYSGDGLEVHLKNDDVYLQCGLDFNGQLGPGNLTNVTNFSSIEYAVHTSPKHWTAEIAIPWELVKVDPTANPHLLFNMAANMSYQEHGTWLPLTLTPGQFNVILAGRRLVLKSPAASVVSIADPIQSPKLDGNLNDPIWEQVIKSGNQIGGWQKADGTVLTRPRTLYLASDTNQFYVAMTVDLSRDRNIVSSQGQPEQGDHLQIDFENFSFGVDLTGKPLQILLPYQMPMEAAVTQTDDRLTLEMAVDWTQLGGQPDRNQPIRINFSGLDSVDGFVTWQQATDARDLSRFGHIIVQ